MAKKRKKRKKRKLVRSRKPKRRKKRPVRIRRRKAKRRSTKKGRKAVRSKQYAVRKKKSKKKAKKKKAKKKKAFRPKKKVKKPKKKAGKKKKIKSLVAKPKALPSPESEVESTADRTAMQIYLKQIEKIPLLTPDEEVKLSKSILSKARDAKRSREKMIQSNLRLVISIAKRYTNLGLLFSDLVEEGNIGLMRAVEKFNWKRGYRFSTYASWWIKQAIMRSISNYGKTIRIPVYMFDTISKYRKVKDNLAQKLGHQPSKEELAKAMRCTVEKIEELESTLSTPSSLNAPISLERSSELMEIIEDRRIETPHEAIDAMFRSERVKKLLALLDERAREILIRRYGLETEGEGQTLEEVAQVFNITRERVRQIEVTAIETIRKKLEEGPEDFSENA